VAASINQILSAVNFFMNIVMMGYHVPKYFNFLMTVDALEVIFAVCKTLTRSMTLRKLKEPVLET